LIELFRRVEISDDFYGVRKGVERHIVVIAALTHWKFLAFCSGTVMPAAAEQRSSLRQSKSADSTDEETMEFPKLVVFDLDFTL
jgi:hypothetical protein